MKKKSLFAIMLIALVLTLGLVVSCQPDPDPDELQGTWTYVPAPGFEFSLNSDGFGKYTFTSKIGGEVESQESGSYTLDNGFVVISDGSSIETHTSAKPEYVFLHPIDASHFHIGFDDDPDPLTYSDDPSSPNYDNYYQDSLTMTGVGPYTLSNDMMTFVISGSSLSFDMDIKVKIAGNVVFEEIAKGSASCVDTGDDYPNPIMYFYNESFTDATMRIRYIVSGNTLTLYMDGIPMEMTKN